jgi:murein DD-endopeptidase MepM/ murein hydrolase activator NlpD
LQRRLQIYPGRATLALPYLIYKANMQIILTRQSSPFSKSFFVGRWQVALLSVMLLIVQLLVASILAWLVMYLAIKGRWPLVSQIAHTVLNEEMTRRDQFLRENINALATKVGTMQAQLIQLESLGSRVGSLAGIKAASSEATLPRGSGGAFYPIDNITLNQLDLALKELDQTSRANQDYLQLLESRLINQKAVALLQPTQMPVSAALGSGFGWRTDPFTGQNALHTGQDFPVPQGTPITAAAAGIVLFAGWENEYGNTVEISHGNGLVTRYAHGSKILVKTGDIVKSAQAIMQSGNSGRSTGPHLHFEVIVNGVFQNPMLFLANRRAEQFALGKKSGVAINSKSPSQQTTEAAR